MVAKKIKEGLKKTKKTRFPKRPLGAPKGHPWVLGPRRGPPKGAAAGGPAEPCLVNLHYIEIYSHAQHQFEIACFPAARGFSDDGRTGLRV